MSSPTGTTGEEFIPSDEEYVERLRRASARQGRWKGWLAIFCKIIIILIFVAYCWFLRKAVDWAEVPQGPEEDRGPYTLRGAFLVGLVTSSFLAGLPFFLMVGGLLEIMKENRRLQLLIRYHDALWARTSQAGTIGGGFTETEEKEVEKLRRGTTDRKRVLWLCLICLLCFPLVPLFLFFNTFGPRAAGLVSDPSGWIRDPLLLGFFIGCVPGLWLGAFLVLTFNACQWCQDALSFGRSFRGQLLLRYHDALRNLVLQGDEAAGSSHNQDPKQ